MRMLKILRVGYKVTPSKMWDVQRSPFSFGRFRVLYLGDQVMIQLQLSVGSYLRRRREGPLTDAFHAHIIFTHLLLHLLCIFLPSSIASKLNSEKIWRVLYQKKPHIASLWIKRGDFTGLVLIMDLRDFFFLDSSNRASHLWWLKWSNCIILFVISKRWNYWGNGSGEGKGCSINSSAPS